MGLGKVALMMNEVHASLASGVAPVVAFFDVDGTLVKRTPEGPGLEPTARVCNAVRAFIQQGGIAVISTGRARVGIGRLLELVPFQGCVTMDGAYVEYAGDVIVDRCIPLDILERAVHEMQRLGMAAFLEGTEQCAEFNPRGVPLFDDVPMATTLSELRDIKPDLRFGKIDFGQESYNAYRASEYLSRALRYYDVGEGNHELVMPGVDKGMGARALLGAMSRSGCIPAKVYAFGDSENDLSLFDLADVSVAMG